MPTFALGILCENVQNSVNKCSILNNKTMKKLLLLAVALMGSVVAKADSYTVSDVSMISGSTGTISVSLTNAAAVRDFQVSVAIPTGFTFVSASTPLSYYTVDTDAVANTTTNATVTFIGYSTGNAGNAVTIAAGTTEVLQIVVSTAANAWAEANDVATSAGKATNDAAAASDVTAATFDLIAGIVGDVSKDSKVNSTDVSGLYNYIAASKAPSELGAYAMFSNINGDASLNSTDVSGIYNIIANSSSVKEEVDFVEEAPVKAEVKINESEIVWGD